MTPRAGRLREMPTSLNRIIFLITVLCSGGIFWLADHPPMTDVPQHAGQIALLLEGLHGQLDPNVFYVNLFTPYLLGYAMWTLLALITPLGIALKALLTLTLWLFVASSVALRRDLGADERLDWLALPAFFGFSFKWGLLTFIMAAPIGMLFILQSMRYARNPTRSGALGLLLGGTALFFCHGLVFVLCLVMGSLFLLLKTPRLSALCKAGLPYAALLALTVVYIASAKANTTNNSFDYAMQTRWAWGDQDRLVQLLLYPWGDETSAPWIRAFALVPPLCPVLINCRFNRRPEAYIPIASILLIWAFVPDFALKTFLLYERFSLFTLPFFALMLSPALSDTSRKDAGETLWERIGLWVISAIVVACMVINACQFSRFDAESRDFDLAVSKIPEGGRALALIFDKRSDAARNHALYTHYASWYQAEHGGIVDFSFAWFHPQMVRYKQLPPVKPEFEWHPETLDWEMNRVSDYDYLIVRSLNHQEDAVLEKAPCPPRLAAESGPWRIYAITSCH